MWNWWVYHCNIFLWWWWEHNGFYLSPHNVGIWVCSNMGYTTYGQFNRGNHDKPWNGPGILFSDKLICNPQPHVYIYIYRLYMYIYMYIYGIIWLILYIHFQCPGYRGYTPKFGNTTATTLRSNSKRQTSSDLTIFLWYKRGELLPFVCWS